MRNAFLITFLLTGILAYAQAPKASSGKIIRWENVSSKDIAGRNVDIWLPEGYNASEKYAVLYMHDGQMLFDTTITWNKQEWMVDEIMSGLMKEGKIRNTIVVGDWNNEKYRHAEYFPEKPIQYIVDPVKDSLLKKDLMGKALADEYLSFLVNVVKPRVDNSFSTLKDRANTFIMGSSMGGLISMYAISEYPDIFGGAACLSTHWIGSASTFDPSIPNSFNKYIAEKIPSPETHKIYFDHGTVDLDALYGKWQEIINATMVSKGYAAPNFMTMVFPGENHSEKAWAKRLNIPLTFLLSK